jgi:hypothetical protein
MKNLNRIQVVFILISLTTAIMVFWSISIEKKGQTHNSNLISEPPLSFGQITKKERIQHVEWTYVNGRKYDEFILDGGGQKKFIITYYQPNPRDPGLAQEERRGGVLVFEVREKTPVLIWESKEDIILNEPMIEVKDITGDNKVEIVSKWSDGKTDKLYIYSWDGKTFQFITPVKKVESIYATPDLYTPIFGASFGGDIEVKDIDDDSIAEILIIGVPVSDNGFITNIYKWNGAEYYLWKGNIKATK